MPVLLQVPGRGVFNDLNVGGDVNTINAEVTGDAHVMGDLSLDGNLVLNSVSGLVGNVVIKTSPTTQSWGTISAGSITPGVANQVFVTNPAGTAGIWSSDIDLPGNLTVTGDSHLNTARVDSVLKLGGNFTGTLGAVCVSDNAGVPHWEYPQYFAQYRDNNPIDMNGAPTVLLMPTAVALTSNPSITYLAGLFTLLQGGVYYAKFETRASTSAAKTQVNFRLNGSIVQSSVNIYIPSLTESQPLNLEGVFGVNAGTTLEIVSQPLISTGISTSGVDSNGNPTTRLTIIRLG